MTASYRPFVSVTPALTAILIPYLARSSSAGSNASKNERSYAGGASGADARSTRRPAAVAMLNSLMKSAMMTSTGSVG